MIERGAAALVNSELSDLWTWIPTTIDQGWATLVAAVAGFLIVAYQTKQGFKSLSVSQAKQAALDREAREHQAELDRQADQRRRRDEAVALASALTAELTAAHAAVSNGLRMLSVAIAGFEHVGDHKITEATKVRNYLPRFNPLVYRSNVGTIGQLGPSIAHDVVDVYNTLLISETIGDAEGTTGEVIATVLSAYREMYRGWLLDCMHVHARLLSFSGGKEDPGALFFERQKRTAGTPARETANPSATKTLPSRH